MGIRLATAASMGVAYEYLTACENALRGQLSRGDDAVRRAPADESFQAAKARVVEQFERSYIEQILIACDGSITHAATAAKKNRRAPWELIRNYRIEPKRFCSSPEKRHGLNH